MKNQLCSLAIIVMVIASSCSMMTREKPQSITGRWTGNSPDGTETTLLFNKDLSLEVTIRGAQDFSIDAMYKVDYSTTPISIDIFNMSFAEFKDAAFMGIAEFRGNNRILLQGNFGESGQATRPSTFNDEAIEYTRVSGSE